MRKFRSHVLGAVGLAAAMLLAACQQGEDVGTGESPKGSIVVGVSGAFAENQIVAEMYAQVLENAGYEVERKLTIDSREISQPAIEAGEIDLKPEYLATLLVFLDQDAEASSDPAENAAKLEPLLEEKDLELLEYSAADDTNALVVTKATAEEHNLSKTSDLTAVDDQFIFGGPPECPNRPFCLPGLKEVYGLEFKEFKPLDVGGPLTVQALESGEIDVALLFSTSGVISQKGFVLLEDDKGLQRAENIAPVIREEVVNDEIRDLLNAVSAVLTTENITQLNARVEIDQEDPRDVARSFLENEGLL